MTVCVKCLHRLVGVRTCGGERDEDTLIEHARREIKLKVPHERHVVVCGYRVGGGGGGGGADGAHEKRVPERGGGGRDSCVRLVQKTRLDVVEAVRRVAGDAVVMDDFEHRGDGG